MSPTKAPVVYQCMVCGQRLEPSEVCDPDGMGSPILICRDCMEGRSKVLVRMRDGTGRKYPQNKVFRGNYCLMTNGGQNYHTHVNCYLRWNSTVLRRFNGWRLTPKDELVGIKKCPFCSASDGYKSPVSFGTPLYTLDHYEGREPLGTMSFLSDDPYLRMGYLLVPGQGADGGAEFFTGHSHVSIPDGVEPLGFDDPYNIHFVTSMETTPSGTMVTVSVYRVLLRKNGAIIESDRNLESQ